MTVPFLRGEQKVKYFFCFVLFQSTFSGFIKDAPDLETLDLYGGEGSEGPGETVTDPQEKKLYFPITHDT